MVRRVILIISINDGYVTGLTEKMNKFVRDSILSLLFLTVKLGGVNALEHEIIHDSNHRNHNCMALRIDC